MQLTIFSKILQHKITTKQRFIYQMPKSAYQLVILLLYTVGCLVVTIFCPIPGFCQNEPEKKESPFSAKSYERFSWGARIGPNVTFPHFSDPDAKSSMDPLPAMGFVVTGITQFRLGERYSFVAEIGYSQKTSKFSYANGNSENTLHMQFTEMSMALRRRFNFKLKKDVYSEFYIHAGPNVDYWISGKGQMATGDGPPAVYNVVFDQTPDGNYNNLYLNGVNRWLFGIDLGIGANAPITPKQKIYIEFRATLGQTNLGTNSSTSYINLIGFGGSDIQQNLLKSNLKSFTISAAYTFSYNYLSARTGHSTKDNLKKKKKKRGKKRKFLM